MIKETFAICSLDCPDTCRLKVKINDQHMIQSIEGDKEHPITQGLICNKMRFYKDRIYHTERIKTPLKRIGKKGEAKFEPISWDEALDIIYDRFQDSIDKYGSESILPFSYAGTMGIINNSSMDRRFFHRLGASRLDRTICASAGCTGYFYTMGESKGVDPEHTVNAEYIIIWGTNTVSTNLHQWQYVNRAKRMGAKVVVIDSHRNKTAKLADWFLQINPGTDGALALAIMHVLINDNFIDKQFIENKTTGFDSLKMQVQSYDPETVAKITGISSEHIFQLAREYGKNQKSFIRIGNGLQHHVNGGMATRNISCLPALTGAWKYKGCGALKSNSEYFNINKKHLEYANMDIKPARSINMNQLGEALLNASNPNIHCIFVYNSNPVTVVPNQNLVIQGFMRDDLFTVVHEQFITDTVKYADIVLPAPTSFEYLDLYRSYWHLYLQLSEPVIPLQGEAIHNTELFRRLAKRFGFHESCFTDSDEELMIQALSDMIPNKTGREILQVLKEKQYIKVKSENACTEFLSNLKTPSGRIELDSIAMKNEGHSSVPSFTRIQELVLQDTTRYPLVLINAPNHMFLNSTFANASVSKEYEGRPMLEMHPLDAVSRSIDDNSVVEIRNERGSCRIHIRVTKDVPQGTVISLGLWWNESYIDNSNLNQFVSQQLSDMGDGPIFFSTFVEVTRVFE
ncbi:oxidoreductase [Desulfuribacillus stibiiarsenatis]|uniref:Oxidoreductase n=1 Tax=Desulfuribacillus stibiiarsenatis TaxID=1390249 RepID=A0A1E5L3P2_9FIRM|nr:molybdopterin oxidoreductase family protein [Desulfuribacillus stibiiarsenatis]OEH84752.1 oxidoreductase [Desulfuribacillus stibiiarsenatis]